MVDQLVAAKPDDAENLELIRLMDYPDSTEDFPVIDLTDYRAGKPGAREVVAKKLREITETVGFFYLTGHGVPRELMDKVFEESRRFHEQPLEVKQKVGYINHDTFRSGFRAGNAERTAKAQINLPGLPRTKENLQATFAYNRWKTAYDKLPADQRPAINAWPDNLPGFKETLKDFQARVGELAKSFLPIWAETLDMPLDYFDKSFSDPHLTTAMLWYPPQTEIGNRQYGSQPHADNSFMTFLMQGNVRGLAVRMPSGHWRVADVVPGAFMVNTGNTMVRWTNGRYLSTKHRVINNNTVDRYSVATFFGPNLDATIECVPTCQGPDDPARYEPIVYRKTRDNFYGFY